MHSAAWKMIEDTRPFLRRGWSNPHSRSIDRPECALL